MSNIYRPEGEWIETATNKEYLSTPSGLERAMRTGAIVEGIVTLCDERMRLHVDLGCAHGIIASEEAVYCRAGEERKDIAIITRVGKPVACKVIGLENRNGALYARLSRRLAQEECMKHALASLHPGDIIDAKVTHMEPFGAFLDIGCGVSSLLSVDCISVSRISHPRDRLRAGMSLSVVVKSVQKENERIYVSLRELLGTWEENVACFEAGQTVTGVIRSVESYGVFVELSPNLAGLAEVSEESAQVLRERIGESVAVYIKSIVPERMKIKLVLIDDCCTSLPNARCRAPLRFFLSPNTTHLSRWIYSPADCRKVVESVFDTDSKGDDVP